MAQQGHVDNSDRNRNLPEVKRQPLADPLDSGLRRKFLDFCEDNPWADECRIHDL